MSERAADHVVTRVPVAVGDDSAGACIARLAGQTFDAADVIYVVDSDRKLNGAARLVDVLSARPEALMKALARHDYPRVDPDHDQEQVAGEVVRTGVTSAAVVDGEGVFIGAVPARSLIEILRREHVEDLLRLAGIQRESDQNLSALESPPLRRARHRLPWLIVGLAGSFLAAAIVSRFERILERSLSVAFFVPAIVYLADAIGTQTEAIVVRGLSLSRRPLSSLLGGELRTGLLIGTTLGALSLPVTALFFGGIRLGVTVGLSIVVAGTFATTIGLLLPWLLQRLGTDPAFGSGPVATIVQDLLSLLIYFAIAAAIMN